MIVGSPFWSEPTMGTRHEFTSLEWILKIKVTLLLHHESLTSSILVVVHRLSSWVWLLIAPLAWQIMSEAPSNRIRAHPHGRLPGQFLPDSPKSCVQTVWWLQQWDRTVKFWDTKRDNNSVYCFGSLLYTLTNN